MMIPTLEKRSKQPFKVYRQINELKSVKERKEYGAALVITVTLLLSQGFNPYDEQETLDAEKRVQEVGTAKHGGHRCRTYLKGGY